MHNLWRQQTRHRTDARQLAYAKGIYLATAKKAKQTLERFAIMPLLVWIPRDKNDIADELSKAELKKAGVEFRIQPEA